RDAGAEVCRHCDFDFASGQRITRTYEKLTREWESGWPYKKRLNLFFILQGLNLVTVIISVSLSGSVPVSIFGGLLNVALQAFLCGSYDRINLDRNTRGQVRLTRTWRFGFF